MNRELTTFLRQILDDFIPPVLRDNRFFMLIPFKLLFKRNAELMMDFKQDVLNMSDKNFTIANKKTIRTSIRRKTDLNNECIKKILHSIKGKSVLEVGCGNGFLSNILSKKYSVTAVDVFIRRNRNLSNVRCIEANIKRLPFKNSSFDTVICTHTLEHVRELYLAISELRRVTKDILIIVVPKQRPYKYTLDTHLNFFPYEESLIMTMGSKKSSCIELKGDLFYIEYK